jgi:PAS domain S-box-containing protein
MTDKTIKNQTSSADLPSLQEANAALRTYNERYRAILQSAMDGFCLTDNAGRLRAVNTTYCRMSGYSEQELLAMSISDLESAETAAETAAHILKITQQGEDRFESRHRRKDGTFFDVEISVQYQPSDGGHLVCFLRDITEQKRIATASRESTDKFLRLADTVPGHVAYVDATTLHYQYVNAAFEKSFGIPQNEIIGRHITQLIGEANYQHALPYIKQVRAGQAVSYENTFQLVTGTRWIRVNYNPVFDEQGKVVSIAVLSYDITESRQAEELLRQANREFEAFARTVSHDLRTPLTSMIGYAELLSETCRTRCSLEGRSHLAEIIAAGEKMQRLTADILALASVGQMSELAQSLDTGDIARKVVADLARQLSRAGVSVSIGTLPMLTAPRTLLTQLFDNLIVNALHYGTKAGDVIEVGGERLGERVRLYVRDHGPGIPAAECEHIFDVFFRGAGSAEQQGTGVGLATVQKIAGMLNGRAWVEVTPGGGSTFWLDLADVQLNNPT